jgi:hypothetical protein
MYCFVINDFLNHNKIEVVVLSDNTKHFRKNVVRELEKNKQFKHYLKERHSSSSIDQFVLNICKKIKDADDLYNVHVNTNVSNFGYNSVKAYYMFHIDYKGNSFINKVVKRIINIKLMLEQ